MFLPLPAHATDHGLNRSAVFPAAWTLFRSRANFGGHGAAHISKTSDRFPDCILFGLALIEGQQTSAATLQLSWADNSSDESGFSIERKLGVGGIFAVVNKTAANVTAYSDPGLADNTTYCYRVNAFNNSGS